MKLKKLVFGLFVLIMSGQSFQALKLNSNNFKWDISQFIEWKDNNPKTEVCKIKNGIYKIPSGLLSGFSFVNEIDFNNVTYIPEDVCSFCQSLTKVNAADAIRIGCHAFNNCPNLILLNIPKVELIDHYAFQDCKSISAVNMPKTTEIGVFAFGNCPQLKVINAPSATCMGEYSFSCSKITCINIPKVKYIPFRAFSFIPPERIYINNECTLGPESFEGCGNLNFILSGPPSTILIEESAFWYCVNYGKPIEINFLISEKDCTDSIEKGLKGDKPIEFPETRQAILPEVVFYSDSEKPEEEVPGATYFKNFPASKLVFKKSCILCNTKFRSCRSLEQVDLDFDLSEEETQKFLKMSHYKRECYNEDKGSEIFITYPVFQNCIRLKTVNINRNAYDMISKELQKSRRGSSSEEVDRAIAKALHISSDVKINPVDNM